MISNLPKNDSCLNCGACYNTCPKGAISIDKDNYFYNIKIDNNFCVNCGLCLSVCPVLNEKNVQSPIKAYAGFHKDNDVVTASSSGGAFNALSNYVLKNNGVVFGAVFSEDSKSVVISHTDSYDLIKLQKSKYVESLPGENFKKVKQELENGRYVLFCGTPCQIAGLKSFLKCDYEKLITVDFSCGGLPSHKIYEKYVEYLEEKYNSNLKKIDFRPKTYGWEDYAILAEFQNQKIYSRLASLDPFFKVFLNKCLSVRDNCYKCQFSNNHYSDIILADFWLHKKIGTSKSENKNGISLIIANSEKGNKIVLNELADFCLEELDIQKASYNLKGKDFNEQLFNMHTSFFNDLSKDENLIKTVNKYVKISFKTKVKLYLKQILNRRK